MIIEESNTNILQPITDSAEKENHISLQQHSDITKNHQICLYHYALSTQNIQIVSQSLVCGLQKAWNLKQGST